MNRLILPFLTASALIFGTFLPIEEAAAQTTAKDIVGTWTLVSITLEQDGKKADFFGTNPQGQLMYDAHGHFSVHKFTTTNSTTAGSTTGVALVGLSTRSGSASHIARTAAKRPGNRQPN